MGSDKESKINGSACDCATSFSYSVARHSCSCDTIQFQSAVTVYFKVEQLLLFVFTM